MGGGAGGAKGGGDFAGDEAGFADSGDDGAVTGMDGFGKEFSDAVEGFAHGALKALSEEFEGCSFDADELSGIGDVVRHGAKKMVAVRQVIEDG